MTWLDSKPDAVQRQAIHDFLSRCPDQEPVITVRSKIEQGVPLADIGYFMWHWFIQKITNLQAELDKAQLSLTTYGINYLITRCQELNGLLDAEKHKLKEAEQRIQQLEKEKNDFQFKITRLEAQFSDFRANTAQMKNRYEKQLTSLYNEIAIRNGIIAEQQLRLERLIETDD